MSVKRKLHLTEEERQMYKSERLDNFRWISRLVASYSNVQLKDSDKVPAELCEQLSDIGQYSEIVYSTLPMADLLKHYDVLSRPGFPLEGYTALQGATLEGAVVGDVAKLPAAVCWRPSHKQMVVAICGTKLAKQALQDVRFLKTRHPSGKGQVHTGFWSLYMGLRDKLKSCLREALRSHDAEELVLTGHSMGGAIAYLLGIDILAEDQDPAPSGEQPIPRTSVSGSHDSGPDSVMRLKLVSFGMPRVGDEALVQYFHSLMDSYRERHGKERVLEYSVRTYNDGVPALPPVALGYRHFSKQPLYAAGGDLYYIPSSERERTLFHIQDEKPEASETKPVRFPLGGHNYYGGRELERLHRRLVWLEKSDFFEGDDKWEDRYLSMAQKHSTA